MGCGLVFYHCRLNTFPESGISFSAAPYRRIPIAAGGVGTSGSERCHLHEDQAQNALDRPVVEKTTNLKKCTRTADCFIGLHPGTERIFTMGPCVFSNHTKAPAEGRLGSRNPLRVLPLTPTHRCLRLEWCHTRRNWNSAEWNQVFFSDISRFNLSSDYNRVRVWRHRGERLNPAFALQRHTAPSVGVMVWGAIAYNTRSPLLLIRGTTHMIAQRYVHDILQPHVLSLMQRLLGAIFQQDNAPPHTARVSQDCLHTVTIFPLPSLSPNLSPVRYIWDHFG
ncbi:transposable element Tcb2 transposase [Trichonephila clavipes]|uniref:Transposable element Tcb2 transposase n=1 Tax=Trichonephila clavipes TaxID=2585209 RepID=A0A8X6W180_TRICX|nr:transposable element Tcb2 transposase [Trichonephila clavipes]